jgi:hypothetical protein
MNAPQTCPFSFGSRRCTTLATFFASLLILGCQARTPLWSHSSGSSDDETDAGEQTGGTMGAAGQYGRDAQAAAGRGGTAGTGGIMVTGGILGLAGATAGAISGTGGITGANTSAPLASGGGILIAGGNAMGGYAANGGTLAAGGTLARGGSPAGGSIPFTGGAPTNRGGSPAGGIRATGGVLATGGSVATAGTAPVGTPAIQPDGYVTLATGTVVMAGHVSSYMSGSGSSLSLTYGSNSFCASGTVAADSTYNSWAGAGFNVNQAESGASGSSTSLVLNGSTMTVNYSNNGGSPLEFQIYDGSHYWCAYLVGKTGPTTIPFSTLNSQCWNGLGSSFTSGTPITAVQLVVGGSGFTPTPFDFCFLGLTVQ